MRTSVPAAVAALALGLPVLFLDAAPAQAASIFVEINPSTARPGDEVTLRASCTDNLAPATVTGGTLGTVTVKPQYGFLTATARIPTTTKAGDYQIKLTCPDNKTATATLHVVAANEAPSKGPATGGGGTAPGRSAPMLIGGGLTAIVAGLALAISAVLRRRRFG
jgi:hypothetical protein